MTILARANQLELRLTSDPAEIEAAQRLRYRVFYEEMGAVATPAMRASGIDSDRFDAIAEHLVVVDLDRGTADGGVRGRLLSAAARVGRPRAAAASTPRTSSTSRVSGARMARSWSSAAPASSPSTGPAPSCSCCGAASPTTSPAIASA